MTEEKVQKQENSIPKTVVEGSLPDVTDFRVGDTVRVVYKIIENNEVQRTQPFEGIVISKKGSGASKTFTVRKMSGSIGVERIFPLDSPFIDKVEINKHGKVRRARIYYLRELTGKKARIKEKRF